MKNSKFLNSCFLNLSLPNIMSSHKVCNDHIRQFPMTVFFQPAAITSREKAHVQMGMLSKRRAYSKIAPYKEVPIRRNKAIKKKGKAAYHITRPI